MATARKSKYRLGVLFLTLWIRGYRQQAWRSIDAVLFERQTYDGLRGHKGKRVFELFALVSERNKIYFAWRGSWQERSEWLFNNFKLGTEQKRFKWGHDFNNIGPDWYPYRWIGPVFKVTMTKDLTYDVNAAPWYGYDEFYAVGTPHWVLIILFSILPLLAFSGVFKRRQRLLEGHCIHCGYDLRATPDRCPECGKVPTDKAQSLINQNGEIH